MSDRRRLFVRIQVAAANILASGTVLADEVARPGVDTAALLRVTVGLAVVLLLIVGLGWVMRRLGGVQSHGNGKLRVLAGVSVGPKERVVLLRAGDKQLLLGVGPGQVRTLHVFDQPLEEDGRGPASGVAGADMQGGFQSRLRELMQNRKPR
ncbi:MAG: flagellar biosynthetic protein FliO [Ectothiorhodospiraceae bacterium]|nr:flagellar biosynthetic protein FliO [Ectothiorhodospiraceae bacterium]